MFRLRFIMRGMAAASAMMLAVSPALAGDEERARAAIAEAQGKIDAANRVKAGDVTPDAIARAQASLRLAQEELKSGHEQKAIQAAIDAQEFADSAIGRTQQHNDAAAEAQAATVATAQEQAAAANARADAAAADAQAARSAPPVILPAPTATTTVTTETVKTAQPTVAKKTAAKRPTRKVVRHTTNVRAHPTVSEKTTTTVTTQQ